MHFMDVLGEVVSRDEEVGQGEVRQGGGREVVTLDGPAASGKSSVARRVAEVLGVPFVSSGLLYRAATYLALNYNVDPKDEAAVLTFLARHEVELVALRGAPDRILFGGEDISAQLHTTAVDANVSAVARHPGVREWVNARLREIRGSFVIEGRDMGAVVFPNAAHKFYLSAPAEVRAARRVNEREESLQEVARAIRLRDERDAKQLAPAPDAVHIETQDLTLEGVAQAVLREVRA